MLINRGIKPQDIQHYLHTTDEDILSPHLIQNIEDGVKMLISHIAQNDKVLIIVDCDADGYTSAAILINYLYCLFPGFVQNNIIYRIHTGKQHGIELDMITEDIKLVICPDSASEQYELHTILAERGIDVLVIDHHEAERISENACVINNQLCDYPTKSLSGAGMVYKFCCYIDELMNTNYANEFVDLVALGLTADMMSLRDFETKRLVEKGLQQVKNLYFKGMVERNSYSLGEELTPIGVAFYIAPYVNATIRVGTQEEKLLLFEAMLDYQGSELIPSTKRGCKGQVESKVEQACRNCTNIKNRQTKAVDASLNEIERIIETEHLLENKILSIKLPKELNFDKTVTGLIANKLMSNYQRPVLLLHQVNSPEETRWEGSARGYDKSEFKDFRGFLLNSGFVNYASGHANAFGASISDNKFDAFIQYSNQELQMFDFSPKYNVDFIFSVNQIQNKDILEIAEYKKLWGQAVDEPYVAIENIQITKNNLQLMSPDKNPTVKITLPNGMSLIKFRSSKEEYKHLYSDLGCVTINVVGRCERNIWNGIISPQIIIENYEVVQRTNYYF